MTRTDRPNAALLVIDVQNGVVESAVDRDQVVSRIGSLVERARDGGTPVVWVQHHDERLERNSDAWQIVDALRPAAGEPVVHKSYGDAFEGTDLEDVLGRVDAGRLVVTGASTDACIRSTLHGAITRGYDTTLVGDAHTTEDMRTWGSPIGPEDSIAYTNMYWAHTRTPDAKGSVVEAAEVDFSARPAP